MIRTLVTHSRPHPDEAAALAILKMYGRGKYATVDDLRLLRFLFVDAGYANYQGRDPDELEQDGIVQIGVGSGRFNEHATDTEARLKNETAATLVAKTLGVERRPDVVYILNWIKNNDLKGQGAQLDLAHSMRVKYQDGQSDAKVLLWAAEEVMTHLRAQQRFHREAVPELQKAKTRKIRVGAMELTITTIRSDNDQLLSVARSRHGLGTSILVIERSSGNIQVLPVREDLKERMSMVIAGLRLLEAKKGGITLSSSDARIYGEAKLPEIPEWHFQVETGMCFNGSLTANTVRATRLTLSDTATVIEEALRLTEKDGVLKKLAAKAA